MITEADLEGVMFDMAAHYNMGSKGYGYGWRCQKFPRLMFIDRHYRPCSEYPDGANMRTYYVDGAEQESFTATIAALNVPAVLTGDEARILEMVPLEFTPLRAFEDDIAGVPRPNGGIMPDTPHSRVLRWLECLHNKGKIEYGKNPERGDGTPWDEVVPEHCRYSPTIRRVRDDQREHQ